MPLKFQTNVKVYEGSSTLWKHMKAMSFDNVRLLECSNGVHNLNTDIFTSPDVLVITAIPPFGQVGKSELSSGEDVEVTLKGTGFLTMEPFMGFLLQVQ